MLENFNMHSCTWCAGCDLEKPLLRHYPLVTGDSSTIISIQDSETYDATLNYMITSTLSYSSVMLSVNGTLLVSNGRKFNLSQTTIGSSTLLKEINFQYNVSDEGFYIYQPYILYYYIEDELRYYYGYRCYDHSDYALDLNQLYISFTTLPFVLKTYSKHYL